MPAVRQSIGEPDPFRLRYRGALRDVVGAAVRGRLDRRQAVALIREWTQAHIGPDDRERFEEIAEDEQLALHMGNFARYQIRPSEFQAWQEAWRR